MFTKAGHEGSNLCQFWLVNITCLLASAVGSLAGKTCPPANTVSKTLLDTLETATTSISSKVYDITDSL